MLFDLIEEGNLELICAVEKLDLERILGFPPILLRGFAKK
jgi:DNA-directed RNA polymerase sigma subunit (sigma70/sigma32)